MLSQALTVAAAKAKLAGLVVAAAAIGGTAVAAGSTAFVPTSGDETVTTTPTETPSPDATTTSTDEVTPTTDGTETAEPTATWTPPPCTGEEKNHGEYVKQVAQDKTLKGREHGKAVSEAARSDCGKSAEDAADAADADETEAPDVEESEAPDADDADATADTPSVKKHGHGKKSR